MSAKNLDKKNRWRSVTVAFRVSPEEAYRLNMVAKTSGLTKQGPVKIYAQNYLQARLSEVNRQ